jgi:hypothetical protein
VDGEKTKHRILVNHLHHSSVVSRDFNVESMTRCKPKAQTSMFVDTDSPFGGQIRQIRHQRLQAFGRRHAQDFNFHARVKRSQSHHSECDNF